MSKKKRKKRVLIVDDEPANIDVLVETLKGYERSIALNGEQALEVARSEPAPDIILLDIMMPGMDGYEVIKQLKADDKTKDIPVIFITAMDKQDDEAMGLALGAVDYITKPISVTIVQARVKTHLKLRMAHLQELENQRLKNELIKQEANKITAQNMVETLDTTINAVVHMLANAATSIVILQQCYNSETLTKNRIDNAVNEMFKALKDIENLSAANGIEFGESDNGIHFEIGTDEVKFKGRYKSLAKEDL
ncbi:MAG: response regulator [Magnetococcales bacterium]|nr:response regulator [Magnetococcales bacterium]